MNRDRAWARTTTWAGIGVAAAATVLLVVLAYTGPERAISETDFSGSTVFVARLAGGAFMLVLTASCLLQAGLYLPQRASRRPGAPAPAVLDVLVIAGVVTETVLLLTVGFGDPGYLSTVIVAGGIAIALVALVRFVAVASSGIQELVVRRREQRQPEPMR